MCVCVCVCVCVWRQAGLDTQRRVNQTLMRAKESVEWQLLEAQAQQRHLDSLTSTSTLHQVMFIY